MRIIVIRDMNKEIRDMNKEVRDWGKCKQLL